jgi:threonine/homoserine/homoserine lactone efflux protein
VIIPLEVVATFVVTSVLLALAPGPDNIFVVAQSAAHGRGAGILITLGLCTGLIVHTCLVATGLAVIFQVSTVAFTGLKIVGACYLMYLGVLSFRASKAHVSEEGEGKLEAFAYYRRGIFMNVTNPKVAIFFLAFLPQFTDPERGPVTTQVFLLGGLFILSASVVFSAIAFFAGFLNTWLARSAKGQSLLNKIAAVVFLALAVKLIVSSAA